MTDREKVIKHFEHLLNAAKGDYQDFVDLTVDVGEEILAMLKEQEAVIRCKDCRHYTGKDCNYNDIFPAPREDWYCADGERRQKNE